MGVGKWKKVQMGISLIFTKNATRYQTTFWIHEEIECIYLYIYSQTFLSTNMNTTRTGLLGLYFILQ